MNASKIMGADLSIRTELSQECTHIDDLIDLPYKLRIVEDNEILYTDTNILQRTVMLNKLGNRKIKYSGFNRNRCVFEIVNEEVDNEKTD